MKALSGMITIRLLIILNPPTLSSAPQHRRGNIKKPNWEIAPKDATHWDDFADVFATKLVIGVSLAGATNYILNK